MSTVTKQSQQNNSFKNSSNSVACRKCKSTQVVANKRGYSFGKMFNTLLITFVICIALAIFSPSLDSVEGPGNLNIIGVILFYIGFPVAIIRGFIGRSDIVNGCMNCGNKWAAGKR